MNAHIELATDIFMPSLGQGMAKRLAEIVTDLLNEHEPLLKATRDGTAITVAERGGTMTFSIAVEPQSSRDSGKANNLPELNR